MAASDGVPTRSDPVAAAMSQVVGGPLGEHAGGHGWWTAQRALLGMTAMALAVGMVGKSACVPSGWSRPDQPFAQLCWTDLAGVSAAAGSPPHVAGWLRRVGELFPGTGTVSTTAGLAVLLAALALLATVLLARVDPRRPWAAAGWALGPVLVAHWLSWDLVAAVALAAALWAWARGNGWLAGVAAGVGAAFALPVALALAGVIAVGGRWRDRVDAVIAAGAAYVVVTLPGRARVEEPDLGSIWLFLEQVGVGGSRTTRTTVQAAALVLALVGVWWIARRVGRPTPRTSARAGLLVLATALVVAPTAPPEHALLVLPLAAVAVRRWRDLLVWQGLTLVSSVVTGWWVGQALVPTITDDARAYWIAILLRVLGLLWLVVAVLRDAGEDCGEDPGGSGDDDPVEVGGGEADPDVDVLADARHPRA